jgi:hypothetical protein
VCDRVGAKIGYAQLVDEVKRDFDTVDYYQGAYLIIRPATLCPLERQNGGAPRDAAAVR